MNNSTRDRKDCGENRSSRAGKILLVDDNESIRTIGARLFSKMGYEVVVAQNGLEAISVVSSLGEEIGLVILDIRMPIMDGPQSFYRLRELDSRLPVIIASGWTNSLEAQELIIAGAFGVLQKPFQMDTISATIATAAQQAPERTQPTA